MSTIGIVVNEGRRAAVALGDDLAAWLEREGHAVRRGSGAGPDDATFGIGLDLVLSLGGDGNILRTVALVADHDVPVLGINFGQLGYLTAVEPAEARGAVERFLAGDHSIEERMALSVTVSSADPALHGRRFVALNEAALERIGTTIRVQVSIDDRFFTTYAADGIIVATPTGSTGYAFSVRGPIIAATHRALLLVPISPHMLFDRALVLGPETVVGLVVEGDRAASLSLDGRTVGTLHDGDAIACTAAQRPVRLVTFGPRDFHAVLKAKFGLNDR